MMSAPQRTVMNCPGLDFEAMSGASTQMRLYVTVGGPTEGRPEMEYCMRGMLETIVAETCFNLLVALLPYPI